MVFFAIVQVIVGTAQCIGSVEHFKTIIIFSKILHKVKFRDFNYNKLTET
jgi:hypothetical protein